MAGIAIEAVIFDFGGVITSSPFDAFNQFEGERGLPIGLIRRINAAAPDDNAWARLERAEIDAAEFDARFAAEAQALGFDLRGAEILALLSGSIRPRMVAALAQIRAAGLRIGCITNNAKVGHGSGMASDAGRSAEIATVMAMFEFVIESSKSGLRKPDPRIYLMMCQQLGVAPQACVYLDDLGINCKPAAQLGMTAIKVTSEQQALDDLGRALDLVLS